MCVAQSKPQDTGAASAQNAAISQMAASIDKQKGSVQKQLAGGSAGDAFFTVPWTSPAAIPVPILNPTCSPMPEDALIPLVQKSSAQYQVPFQLVRAVIRHESDSYPCAVSYRGALGLMQLMPDVAQELNVDPLDPQQNIDGGTRYLKSLISRYAGDTSLALAAYNAGTERVDAEKKVPAIPETLAYVAAIEKDLKEQAAAKAAKKK